LAPAAVARLASVFAGRCVLRAFAALPFFDGTDADQIGLEGGFGGEIDPIGRRSRPIAQSVQPRGDGAAARSVGSQAGGPMRSTRQQSTVGLATRKPIAASRFSRSLIFPPARPSVRKRRAAQRVPGSPFGQSGYPLYGRRSARLMTAGRPSGRQFVVWPEAALSLAFAPDPERLWHIASAFLTLPPRCEATAVTKFGAGVFLASLRREDRAEGQRLSAPRRQRCSATPSAARALPATMDLCLLLRRRIRVAPGSNSPRARSTPPNRR
jgi:hypothetical protein